MTSDLPQLKNGLKMQEEQVKTYFKVKAKEFDEIYDDSGTYFKSIINRVFRKGMKERFIRTLKEFGSENKTVLDIGCGGGRVSVLLAKNNLDVTAIDYSSEMIDLAHEYNKTHGNNKLKLKFKQEDFLIDTPEEKSFDFTLALGIFDYLKEPLPFLKKMKNVTKEKMVVAFPAKFTPQMPLRKIWLMKRKCPVYFYTKKQIEKLYRAEGIEKFKITKIPAAYFVVAYF